MYTGKPVRPAEPVPLPWQTCTLLEGYRFARVRVRVPLGYPRVTRDNP